MTVHRQADTALCRIVLVWLVFPLVKFSHQKINFRFDFIQNGYILIAALTCQSLTILHSEGPKLYGVLAILNAIGLKD